MSPPTLFSRLKPGASQNGHLFAASLLWACVGTALLVRGGSWLMDEKNGIVFLTALLFGTLKSLFILDKSAKKSIDRILQLADGSCLGGVYSITTWGVIGCMILMGYVLRHYADLPVELMGFLYSAIGWSLLFSSREGWTVWLKRK
jgi:hypothetical protein